MRILNLFLHPLFPVSAGDQACAFRLNKELVRSGHEVGLVHLSYSDRKVRRKTPATAPFREEVSLPSPLIHPLLGIFRKVANRIWQSTLGTPLNLPFIFSRANRGQVRRLLEEGRYDVLVVHTPFGGRYLEEMVPPRVRTVVMTNALWYMNFERQGLRGILPTPLLLSRIRKIEYGIIRKFDRIVMLGDYERDILLRDGFPPEQVFLCGAPADVAETLSEAPKLHDLLFVAGISVHNNDALQAFLDHVLPRLRKKGLAVELACAGKICQLPGIQGVPGVKLLGFVEDLNRLYAETRIVVNPVRLGSGVKVKVVEGLARGCAVLTTSNGAEGIGAPAGKAILVCDDLDKWAGLIEEYLADVSRLAALRKEALRWSQDNLSAERIYAPLLAWVSEAPGGSSRAEPAAAASMPAGADMARSPI